MMATRRRAWIWTTLVGAVGLAILAISVTTHGLDSIFSGVGAVATQNPDQSSESKAVERAALDSLTAMYTVGIDPEVPSFARSSSFEPDQEKMAELGAGKEGVISGQGLALAKAESAAATNRFAASGSAQEKQFEVIKQNTDALLANPDYRALGGGVDRPRIVRSTVSGEEATLVIDCVTWKSFIWRNGVNEGWIFSRPSHQKTVTISLVRSPTAWSVTKVSM